MSTRILSMLVLWVVTLLAHAGTVTYVYTDPQGTPLAEADATGTITARFDYAPYGAASTASGMSGAPNGPGYTGHVNDPESGFVYMQARYYDPAAGKFLSEDPVGPIEGNIYNFSRYAYANNNPVANIDPDGRFSLDTHSSCSMYNCQTITSGTDSGGSAPATSSTSPISPIPVTNQQNSSVPSNGYDSPLEAGKAGAKAAGALNAGQEEYLGITLRKDGRYWYTVPVTLHESRGVNINYSQPTGGYTWGGSWFHTHPPGGQRDMVFSPQDVATSVALKWVAVIGFHLDGSMRYFDPSTMHVGLHDDNKYDVHGVQARKSAEGKLICERCFP